MARIRSSPPLLLAGGALAITVVLTLVGLWTVDLLGYAARSSERSAVILAAAGAVARHSAAVASAAGDPTSLAMTPASLEARSADASAADAALAAALDVLNAHAIGAGYDLRLAVISAHANILRDGAHRINAGRPELLGLLLEGRDNYRKFSYDYREGLNSALVTSLDDQLYDMMTWEVAPGQSANPAANPVSRRAVLHYQHTFELLASARVAVGKLVEASVLNHPLLVVIVREEYEAAAQRMRSSLDDHYLADDDAPASRAEINRLSRAILDAGAGENNLFQALDRRLNLAAEEQRLIDDQRQTLAGLHREVGALTTEAGRQAAARADANARNAVILRIVLLVIGIAGVAGAVGAAGYYLRRGAGA